MDNKNDTNVQEVMTEERDGTDTATQMANGQPDPSIDIVTTEAENPPEDSNRPTRVRKQRSFTMSDEVHALLAAQAKRGGSTIGMSAYLETLVLMAEELVSRPARLRSPRIPCRQNRADPDGVPVNVGPASRVRRHLGPAGKRHHRSPGSQGGSWPLGVPGGVPASRLTNSCPGSHLSLRRSHGGGSGSARPQKSLPSCFPASSTLSPAPNCLADRPEATPYRQCHYAVLRAAAESEGSLSTM